MLKKLSWNPQTTPENIQPFLRSLGEEYPIAPNGQGTQLKFLEIPKTEAEENQFCTSCTPREITIAYSGLNALGRGISYALTGTEKKETSQLKTIGIMLDCSRNFVMTVPHLKIWLRKLAICGYNLLMLYTEETYPLEGEPLFGYLRGGYSLQEIREIDDYAYSLGIEVVPCIQTLGHLRQFLKWSPSAKYRDTPSVLLTDSEETYELIRKMLLFWKNALRSRRIHIGMDETHDLGLGKHRDLHGYEEPSRIFNRHLTRVNAMCLELGLQPMIWSDMFFRMANADRGYYHPECRLPENIVRTIPANVQLCYWDYYHAGEEMYLGMLQAHRSIGFEPIMASGIHTWGCLWWNAEADKQTNPGCINACRKLGVREILFTLWGDDGAYCEFDSALAGIFYAGDLSFGEENRQTTARRFQALCGGDFDAHWELGHLSPPLTDKTGKTNYIHAQQLLWDDPLYGITFDDHHRQSPFLISLGLSYYKKLLETARKKRRKNRAGDMLYACSLLELIVKKTLLRKNLEDAYDKNDKTSLREIQEKSIPDVLKSLKKFDDAFRKQWLAKAKPYGLEHIQGRNALIAVRLKETALRLKEYLAGETASIDELDHRLPADSSIRLNPDHCTQYMSSSLIQVN